MRRILPLFVAGAFLIPNAASAQGFAVAGQAGTIGIGGSAIVGISPMVNIKGTFGYVPFEPQFDIDDVEFDVSFPAFVKGTVDVYLGLFYISAGGLFVTEGGDIEVLGTFTGSQEFGDNTYTAEDVGTLEGIFSFTDVMPYAGIGFGNPVGRRLGLNLDLGVGFGDRPAVSLGATGPLADDPTFQSDLAEREAEFQADIPEVMKYYPVISLSLSIGF